MALSLLIGLLFFCTQSFAGKRYWRGTGANKNWNNTANWASVSGGTTGSTVPGTNDTAYFDSGGDSVCTINTAVSVKMFNVTSTYTKTISQGANTVAAGTSGMIFSGGTFSGGSAGITSTGAFTIAGGGFTSTSATLTIAASYTLSSGTFSHNNGVVVFSLSNITITGSTIFYDLTFSPGTSGTFTIASGTTLTCNHTLRTAGVAGTRLNTGVIEAKGDVKIDNTYSATASAYGGTATITINGSAKQVFTGAATIGQGVLCNIAINKTTDTLVLKNYISVAGNWSYFQGILDVVTFPSTVVFASGAKTISGSHTLQNIALYGVVGASVNDIVSTDTLAVTGTITTYGSNLASVNNGTILSKGNITINNTANTTTSHGGTANLVICGTTKQILTGASTLGAGRLCSVTIKKAADTLVLKNYVNVSGDWNYVSGILDAATFSSTVAFTYSNARNITGKHSLYNVCFYASNTDVSTMVATDTLTVNGTLSTDGSGVLSISTGVVAVRGDFTINNTSLNAAVGTATLYFCGIGPQTIDGTTTSLLGRICGVKINKPTGTLYLKDIITLGDNAGWELVSSSTIPNVSSFSSTVVFCRGTRSIKGKLTFDNLTFNAGSVTNTNNINAGDTLVVNNELRMEGTHGNIINTGVVNVLKNMVITNTGNVVGGGSGTINICGTGSQTITGNGIAIAGCLPNVKINKSSDTLHLISTISLAQTSNWTYIQGTVDPGTSTVAFVAGGSIDCDNGTSYMKFNNVTIQGGSTESLAGVLRATGNFKIDAARTLNTNSYALEIGGNWNVLGIYTGGTSKVTFNGAANQYMLAPTVGTQGIYNLEINKAGGKFYLNATSLTVTSALTLTKGVIVVPAAKTFTLADNITSTGGSDSSYVHGAIKKVGNDVFVFALGDTTLSSGGYHPLSITAPSVASDAFTAVYHASAHPNYSGATDASISGVSNCEYWNLTRTTGTSTVTVTLKWNTNSYSIISAPNTRIAYWNTGTSTWNNKGGTASTGTASSGSTSTSAAQSSFGDFTLALTTDVNKYFRSTATGNWESESTWQMSSDNSTWSASTATPYSVSNAITVQSAHTVTINGSLSIDEAIIDGTLIYGNTAGSTLQVVNGSGDDLVINGTFQELGPNAVSWASSSTWKMGSVGTLVRTRSTAADGWRDNYSGGISTIPAAAKWVVRKTGAEDPLLTSTGGMYYPCLYIENTSGSGWVTSGASCFTGSTGAPVIKGNLDIGGAGPDPVIFINNNTYSAPVTVQGYLITQAGSYLKNNGTGFNLQSGFTNSGSCIGTLRFTFSGSSSVQSLTGTAISGIKALTIDKTAGKVFLGTSLTIDSSLTLTKGAIYMTSTGNSITLASGATVSGGSDSSYVSGTVSKIGNTPFSFPLGDVALSTDAYHPLYITAPAVATDAFAAQYYAAGQTYGDSLQADSLENISDCEYWVLTRNTGTSTVIPTLGWNTNSCNIYGGYSLTIAGWNGTQWNKLGTDSISYGAGKGSVTAVRGLGAAVLPIAIGIIKLPTGLPDCVLKKKLDGSYYTLSNGYLKIKYDEEYVNNGNRLEFKIYDKDRNVVISDASTGAARLVKYKDNRFSLNVHTINPALPHGYYVMEVKDRKGEINMLRFKY